MAQSLNFKHIFIRKNHLIFNEILHLRKPLKGIIYGYPISHNSFPVLENENIFNFYKTLK
jgi:hypothetical protein